MNNKIERIIQGLSTLGFINAAYVTYLYFFVINSEKASSGPTICDINNTFSCTKALSANINIFGIPPCTIAMFVYPILIILTLVSFKGKQTKELNFLIISILALCGIFMNLWIVYKESLIGVYCLFCLLCGFIIFSILSTGLYGFLKKN